MLVLHAEAAQMGYLTALEWLPSLLFGLLGGVTGFVLLLPTPLPQYRLPAPTTA